MPPDPFPHPGPDGEEPDSSALPPAAKGTGPEEDWDGEGPAGQGLYVCLPPEQLTLSGFAQGGQTDTMAPGPLLATVVYAVTGQDGAGLAGCSDDQLLGIVSAGRRLESGSAWVQLAAIREFAARHRGTRLADEFAPDELADELHVTPPSAKYEMQYASTVAERLPQTFAALGTGRIHPVHLRIIEDETMFLSEQDVARADAILADSAPGKTFGQVRAAAHKLVLKLDPETAKKRKEAARGTAYVRRFREDSGNAGMVARELPSDEVLASWQHVEQRALDLRAAGMPGTLQELRVRAYLDLLQERDSRDQPADPAPASADPAHPGPANPDPAGREAADDADVPDQPLPGSQPASHDPSHHADDGPGSGPEGPSPGAEEPGAGDGPGDGGGPDGGSGGGGPGGNGGSGGPGPGRGPGPAPGPGSGAAAGPSIAALVTITIPWATYQGRAGAPGHADGYGVLDGDDARDLAAAAARHPATRWCITAVNPDGTAAAHACLPGRHPPPGTGPPSGLNLRMTPVARGPCDHAHAQVGYHPSRTLTHIIRARSGTCTAPGCSRPAARCDLDHTQPWDQGGPTCECNLAPLCRHHHRCKQAEGWQLTQPEPGVLVWRTPAGRSYVTTPTQYPV